MDPRSPPHAQDQPRLPGRLKAAVAGEPDTGLVTGCDLIPGNTGNTRDAETAPDLLEDEPEGTEGLGDSAHGTG